MRIGGEVDVDAAGAAVADQPFGQSEVGFFHSILGKGCLVDLHAQPRCFGHAGMATDHVDAFAEQIVLLLLNQEKETK